MILLATLANKHNKARRIKFYPIPMTVDNIPPVEEIKGVLIKDSYAHLYKDDYMAVQHKNVVALAQVYSEKP